MVILEGFAFGAAFVIALFCVAFIYVILAELFSPSISVLLDAIKPRTQKFGESITNTGKTMAEWLERKLKGKG